MSGRSGDQTYYEILEVSMDAPHHEIVRAYEQAKITYAPDSPALYTMFTAEEAQELRRLVEEAFRTLSNQTKRKDYDHKILGREKTTSATSNEELPDFGPIPEPTPLTRTVTTPISNANAHIKSATPTPQATSTQAVPAGFAKHRFGVYEVKPEVEEEITKQLSFDGPFLRKIRQYKNINLEQLSKETRISRSFLAAVESDDFDALPAPVFVRGFVVQLARLLGLDENKVAASYMEKLKNKGK